MPGGSGIGWRWRAIEVKPISRRIHGVLDYLTAGGLLALPWALGWSGPVASFARLLGLVTAAYSALTDYELGVRRALSFRAHLMFDAASALAFLAAPLFFRRERAGVRAALAGIGLFELAAALLTNPDTESTPAERAVERSAAQLAERAAARGESARRAEARPAVAGERQERATADPQEQPTGSAVDAGELEAYGDDLITTDRVRTNLGRELHADHLARLNINTQGGGVVYLRGQVHSEEERQRILEIVRNTEGVGEIVDELQLAREA